MTGVQTCALPIWYPKKWEDYKKLEVKTFEEGSSLFENNLSVLKYLRDKQINKLNKSDYELFSDDEKSALEHTIVLVQLLFEMCQVKLVIQSQSDEKVNAVNSEDIEKVFTDANYIIENRFLFFCVFSLTFKEMVVSYDLVKL